MLVSSLINYLISAIVHTRYDIASHCYSGINNASVLLSIKLAKPKDKYNNPNQLANIANIINHILREREYRIFSIECKRHKERALIYIILKPLIAPLATS